MIEFTLTGSEAHQAVTRAQQVLGDMAHIGIGTVLDPQQAREAIDAGAEFIVTPTMRTEVIHLCRRHDVPILCGALTPQSGPPAFLREADLMQKLAALEAKVTTMHEQLTQQALQLLACAQRAV